jgi:hypothetical protein
MMSARKPKAPPGSSTGPLAPRARTPDSTQLTDHLPGQVLPDGATSQPAPPPRNGSLDKGARAHSIYALFRFARVRRVSRM